MTLGCTGHPRLARANAPSSRGSPTDRAIPGCVEPLSDIDLNLLPILRALLEERSVTKAANRVGLSQPAMSNALKRLRDVFDDPLFIRQGRQMAPTARALELAGPVGEALGMLASSLNANRGFDPATTDTTWRIASTDIGEWLVIRRFLEDLPHVAPRATLEVLPIGPDVPIDDLASGTLDLAFGVFVQLPPALCWTDLGKDTLVCMVREGHPAVGDELDLDTYLELSHAVASPTGRTTTIVDFVLQKLGLQRHVALSVPRYLELPYLVASTDLCAIAPRSMAETFATSFPVALHPPPFRLQKLVLRMVWHRRTELDPGLRWLRTQLSRPDPEPDPPGPP